MSNSRVLNTLISFMMLSALLFVSTTNWWGCKTEEVITWGPPVTPNTNLLGGQVILADYITDSLPLFNVKVEVVNGPTFYTDSNGAYWLNNISYGKHFVKYSKVGYTSFYTEIDTSNFRTGIPAIYLAPIGEFIPVGKNGGTIHKNNMTLIIPPGALETETLISLNSTHVSTFPDPKITPLDAVYIYPENINFQKPVMLSIASPGFVQGIDSIFMDSYFLNTETYQWEKSGAQVNYHQDSIRVIFSNLSNDQSSIIVNAPWLPAFLAYFEFTLGTWTFSTRLPTPFSVSPISQCVGPGNLPGEVAGESRGVTITLGGTAGISYVITGNISASIGTTETVTFSAVPIPVCKCVAFTRTIYTDIYTAPLTWRYCTLTLFGYACTPWSTVTINKTKAAGVQSSVVVTHNPIPECHNQGGN